MRRIPGLKCTVFPIDCSFQLSQARYRTRRWKALEITNNDELAISRQLAKGQSTNPRYYLCYCDYEINFLANGQCAIWLTQQEMAYHKWIPEDQKMADLVMSPLFEKSPYTTKTAVQLRANDAVGRTLEESISTTPKNKGIKAIQAM